MEFVFVLVMMSFLAFGTIYAIKKSDENYAKKHPKTM